MTWTEVPLFADSPSQLRLDLDLIGTYRDLVHASSEGDDVLAAMARCSLRQLAMFTEPVTP